MSSESLLQALLFLFAGLSAIGGLAAVGQLLLELRSHSGVHVITPGMGQPEGAGPRTEKTISRTRLAVVGLLLLMSTCLSAAGFISSFWGRGLNPALKTANLQKTIRQWADGVGFGITNNHVTDDSKVDLSLTLNTNPGQIVVEREKAFSSYLSFSVNVAFSPSDIALVNKLSPKQQKFLIHDLAIEEDRFGMDVRSTSLSGVLCVKRIPINNSLDRGLFLRTVANMRDFEDVISHIVAKETGQ